MINYGSKEMSEQERRIWENTQKASKDFGDLPIVVIDIEECLTAERNKAQELLEKTRVNPTLEDVEKLYFIIRNNRMTTKRWGGEFLPEIDIARLSEQREQLKEQSVLQSQEIQHTTKGDSFMESLQGSVVVSDEEFAQNVECLTETQLDIQNRNGQQLF